MVELTRSRNERSFSGCRGAVFKPAKSESSSRSGPASYSVNRLGVDVRGARTTGSTRVERVLVSKCANLGLFFFVGPEPCAFVTFVTFDAFV